MKNLHLEESTKVLLFLLVLNSIGGLKHRVYCANEAMLISKSTTFHKAEVPVLSRMILWYRIAFAMLQKASACVGPTRE